ncbi:PREDICTED: putative nuclease HARBI1 isoform X2 [Trachymyrmex cornetzi]|nr:PREDICTED: putative nuclease HARBI1 isoform X2 [Trachymyrmex cornetzi]
MTPEVFDKLFTAVDPYITKQECVREAIPPNIRLEICLCYLASGDSMRSLSYAFRVAHNTISKIVSETCEAIWIALKDTVFEQPSKDLWKKIANEFEENWDFPNCIGAIDGKHVIIQAPPNSGSSFYNYKGQHSINLLAVCDAKYRFTFIDIGAEGRQSDGGVFRNSKLYTSLEENSLQIPLPVVVGTNGPILPYVIVADEAFALKNYMMRPYSRSLHLNRRKKIFNYRLSRARRVIESAFGILVARWRIYRKPIIASLELTKKIVQATCCLHNFIINNESKDRYYSTLQPANLVVSEGLQDIANKIESACQNVTDIRNKFAMYFEGEGAIPWQWEKALLNDF